MRIIENLFGKAAQLEWMELFDEVEEACKKIDKISQLSKPTDRVASDYILICHYLFLLWQRVKDLDKPRDLDEIILTKEELRVFNYTFRWFVFASVREGSRKPNIVRVPIGKLSKEEIARLKKIR